jgi:hypothetical protein
MAPNGAVKPYIIINLGNADQEPYKQSVVFSDIKVNLDIVSTYNGQKETDEISQSILDIICTNGKCTLELEDFNIMGIRYSFNPIPLQRTETGILSRKIISFYHNLRQK